MRDEAEEWLKDNSIEYQMDHQSARGIMTWRFLTENDAMQFRLAFL